MPFVNEYVSEANIEKYGLEEIVLNANPSYRNFDEFSSLYKYRWTVDKDRDIYLMRLRVGKEEFSNRSAWILNISGQKNIIETDFSAGGSGKLSEIPYVVIWDFISASRIDDSEISDSEVLYVLKEALMVYGRDGSVDNSGVVVKFNF